jgi:hypothetical protein
MFCVPGLVFGGTGCGVSHFHVLRSRTHFRQYRGRRVPFSCFMLPTSFLAVPRTSDPVFMFCAPRLIFGGTKVVGSRFHVLRFRTQFRRYRGRQVPFSCFAIGLVFGGTRSGGSLFHVVRSLTHFRRYRVRRVPFSCFALPHSFSLASKASGPISCFARSDSFSAPVFTFCAPGLISRGIEGVGSRFHVLRS